MCADLGLRTWSTRGAECSFVTTFSRRVLAGPVAISANSNSLRLAGWLEQQKAYAASADWPLCFRTCLQQPRSHMYATLALPHTYVPPAWCSTTLVT